MLLGFDALGRPVLGQISNPAATPLPFGQWATPVRKTGVALAVATSFTGFVPQPPAQAAPVFTAFSLQKPLRYKAQDWWSFEVAPPTLATLSQFSAFDGVKPGPKYERSPDWSGAGQPFTPPPSIFSSFDQPHKRQAPQFVPLTFEPQPPASVPFSGFCDFAAQLPYRKVNIGRTGEINFNPVTFPPQGGGTSRKLVNGRLVSPFRSPHRQPTPKIELKGIPVPPAKPIRYVEPRKPLPVVDEANLPADPASLELVAMSALDVADVKAFLAKLDQDEQDAADIAEIVAMLDRDDLD